MKLRLPLLVQKLALTLCVTAGLTACSFTGDENHVRTVVIDDDEVRINPVGTRLNHTSSTMRMAIARGLVGFDESGRVVPALAARWIITDDGLSYIFRLGEARWDDGRQVTSERIARLLTERFAELKNSRLQNDLQVIDEVISMTGRVIEIRLNAPSPNFLQLLAQPEFGLFRAGHGAGPMRLIDEESGMRLGVFEEPSSGDDEAEEDNRWVLLNRESAAQAIARFDAGFVDIILNGRFYHLPLIDQSSIDSNNLQLDPIAGLFGLRFVSAEGFWTVPENREILSMAIDRPALLTSFPSVTAWKVRQKIVPEALDVEGINARPDWSSMTIEGRREFARTHVQSWKATEGDIRPLTIGLPDAPGADILFLRVQSDLQRVGLDARRVGMNEEADAKLIDEVAPYDSARWFLSRLTCAQTPICLNDADTKLEDADAATNLDIKARLYAEVEQQLVDHYNYIPLGVPVRWSLARPGQRGFSVNPRGWHPLNPLVGIPIS
ncbi:MAG: ABC transporter substrate-binding protein [Parasphingorhabdus sp.]